MRLIKCNQEGRFDALNKMAGNAPRKKMGCNDSEKSLQEGEINV